MLQVEGYEQSWDCSKSPGKRIKQIWLQTTLKIVFCGPDVYGFVQATPAEEPQLSMEQLTAAVSSYKKAKPFLFVFYLTLLPACHKDFIFHSNFCFC